MSQDPRDPNLPPTAQPRPYPVQPGGQPEYGYPGQAAQPPPYGYPGAPQAQPYGQPYPQAQQYPAPYGGYQASGYGAAPAKPQPKSPILGIIGCSVVVITGIIAILIGLLMADPMADIIALAPPGSTQIDVEMVPPELLDRLAAPFSWLGMASFAGFGGWVVSIVAAVTNRGRGWGVAGIILGIIAPVAALIAMSFAALAAVS